MPPPLAPALADALARGFTLVTANQRAARAIRHAFDRIQRDAGLTLWTPPEVFSLDTWLARLWRQRLLDGTESRILLNSAQEQFLWRELIASDPESSAVRSPEALASLAAGAWSLLHLYSGADRLRDFTLSADSRAFDRWSRALTTRLAHGRLLTAAQLPQELAFANDCLSPPLALVDFDFYTPALQTLLDTLRRKGTEVGTLSTAAPPAASSLAAASDDADELRAAALWGRRQLDINPAASIAIIVPNLADRRAALTRVLDREFARAIPPAAPDPHPGHAPGTSVPDCPAYEFSLGNPLASLPLTQAALDLLAWTQGPLPLERISALLLSPWLSPSHLNSVAEFDAFDLRQLSLLRPELTLEATIRLAQRSRHSIRLADLIHNLRSLERAVLSEPLRRPFAQWSEAFRTILQASGWTRNAQATSLAFQQHRRFDSALDELATLDAVAGSSRLGPGLPDARQALSALTSILHQTIFAPQSQAAPIQVLGPLELGGVPFDALLFLGADDLAWPSTPSPNPLLPWQLQRALAIPGADRDADDLFAASLTRRIARAAQHVLFSYACNAEDGERRPSPLLAQLKLQSLVAEPPPLPDPLQFVTFPDDLTLPSLPSSKVRGGAQVLKLQAACAFRAFAERRLSSTSLDTRDPGFNALEQGKLVHQVMQLFWTEIKSQDALSVLTSAQRNHHLYHAIDLALTGQRLETPWDDAYLEIQRRRLHNLLDPWLDYELKRTSFTVQPPEQEQTFKLGPLTFRLRIDRIDSTDAGEVIVDYKTGPATPSEWKGDRPDEPQLPLYATLAQHDGHTLAGVAFAVLRAGEKGGLHGYAVNNSILAPRKLAAMEASSLHEQVENWNIMLSDLARDFADGRSAVLPKDYPKTCKHCKQRILCRLNPENLTLLDDDLDEDAARSETEYAIE